MKIQWIGHACFAITGRYGTVVVTDPYEPGGFGGALAYGPVPVKADIVTVSHEHGDHGYVQGVRGKPTVVKVGGTTEAKGIAFDMYPVFHDGAHGAQRGPNTIICFMMDGVRVCHLGDLGHELDAATARSIGNVDVLIVPVGGHFTIDATAATNVVAALNPRIVIPMHYKTDKCDLPIATVEPFIEGKPNVDRTGSTEVGIDKGSLPAETKIIVLEPAA